MQFLTLASTAGPGAISVVNIQAQSLTETGYKCIVVAIHPFFIYRFDENTYNLSETDYASQLSARDMVGMLRFDGVL